MIVGYAIATQATGALVPFAIDWHDGRYHLISLTRCHQAGCTAAAGYVAHEPAERPPCDRGRRAGLAA